MTKMNNLFVLLIRMHPPMIAVGSDDNNPSGGGKCQVFEYNDSTRCVFPEISSHV